jgi:hypothetical protein
MILSGNTDEDTIVKGLILCRWLWKAVKFEWDYARVRNVWLSGVKESSNTQNQIIQNNCIEWLFLVIMKNYDC